MFACQACSIARAGCSFNQTRSTRTAPNTRGPSQKRPRRIERSPDQEENDEEVLRDSCTNRIIKSMDEVKGSIMQIHRVLEQLVTRQ